MVWTKDDITAPIELDTLDDDTTISTVGESERRFGRYILCYEMAVGGMGTISLGRLESTDGTSSAVAIKRIHEHLAHDTDFVQMFLDEARIASRIRHRNVCSVVDYGEIEGIYYMAMEYLAGVPLGRLIKTASTDSGLLRTSKWQMDMVSIIAEAAEGLHAAHELTDDSGASLGVVHRDISPDNVFVTFDGRAKILDFGIAVARDRLHRTQVDTIKGKLGYMAPERLQSILIDRRADIWSLGVCLWEGLTGRRLFGHLSSYDALERISRVRKDPVPPPSTYCPQIPSALDEVVLGALKWERQERYDTAQAFGNDLRKIMLRSRELVGPREIADLLLSLYTVLHQERIELVKTIVQPQPAVVPKEKDLATPELRGGNQKAGAGAGAYERPLKAAVPRTVIVKPEQNALGAVAQSESNGPESRGLLRRPSSVIVIVALIVTMGSIVLVGGFFGLRFATDQSEVADLVEHALPDESLVGTHTPSKPGSVAFGADDASLQPNSQGGVDASTEPSLGQKAISDVGADIEPSREWGDASVDAEVGESNGGSAEQSKRNRYRRRNRAAVGVGVVNVVTRGGWAEVFEKGRHYGPTPRRLTLSAGRHVLVLHPFGKGPPRRVVVTVKQGKTVPVVVNLDR